MTLHAMARSSSRWALARWMLAHTPYRVTRRGPNRFEAGGSSLRRLAAAGFAPGLIVDAGAGRGGFALLARRLFPDADIHMIEPLPACAVSLQKLLVRRGFFFHQAAVTAACGTLYMKSRGDGEAGACVASQDTANLTVEGTTLDRLFAGRVAPSAEQGERVLLRLDLQGHELCALSGAAKFLPRVEVVQIEGSSLCQDLSPREGAPAVREIVGVLGASGFELFDVASLGGGSRDQRVRQGNLVFVRRGTLLWRDRGSE